MEWWLLVIGGAFFAFTTVMQTLRVNNAWRVASGLRFQLSMADEARDWHEKRFVRLQQDCCSLREELSALKSAPSLEQEVDRLTAELENTKNARDRAYDAKIAMSRQVSDLTAKINEKSHEILDLKKKSTLKSESHLTEAMSGLCRFIAANQWMLENNKELRDSLESVREVSNSVESFRTDF